LGACLEAAGLALVCLTGRVSGGTAHAEAGRRHHDTVGPGRMGSKHRQNDHRQIPAEHIAAFVKPNPSSVMARYADKFFHTELGSLVSSKHPRVHASMHVQIQ
jgi:hypothetical protein